MEDDAGLEGDAQTNAHNLENAEIAAPQDAEPATRGLRVEEPGETSGAAESAPSPMAEVFRQRPSTRFLFGLLHATSAAGRTAADARAGSPLAQLATECVPELQMYRHTLPGRPTGVYDSLLLTAHFGVTLGCTVASRRRHGCRELASVWLRICLLLCLVQVFTSRLSGRSLPWFPCGHSPTARRKLSGRWAAQVRRLLAPVPPLSDRVLSSNGRTALTEPRSLPARFAQTPRTPLSAITATASRLWRPPRASAGCEPRSIMSAAVHLHTAFTSPSHLQRAYPPSVGGLPRPRPLLRPGPERPLPLPPPSPLRRRLPAAASAGH